MDGVNSKVVLAEHFKGRRIIICQADCQSLIDQIIKRNEENAHGN